MILNLLDKFDFICEINNSSYNFNFLLQNKFTKSLWTGKISKKVKPVNKEFEIYDLDQRALLAYDLAKLLGVPMPQTKYIDLQNIANQALLFSKIGDKGHYHNYKKIVVTKFCGYSLDLVNEEFLNGLNKKDLLKIFIFDSWIGNFNKKNADYLIDNNGKIWTIDYQLWGIVDDSRKSLGSYAKNSYDFNNDVVFKYCIANKLLPYLDFSSLAYEIFIKKIENLSDNKIKRNVNKYNFYYKNSNEEKINKKFIEYLCFKKNEVRKLMNDNKKI